MDDIVLELEVRKEVVAEEDVVKHLRVPVEDVCVALALLKGLNQRMDLEITRALQGGQRVRELKSLRSPRTITFALGSRARISLTKSLTACASALRCASVPRTGGWKRPNRGLSWVLDFQWLAITKSFLPRALNSPTSGLRTPSGLDQAVLPGSMRPGLTES